MVHVTDMAAAVSFYETLGAQVVQGSKDGDRVLLRVAGGEIGLLAHPPNFQATVPLDQVEERLRAAGAPITQPLQEVGFGRQLQLTSPDGLLIKIDELDPGLFS